MYRSKSGVWVIVPNVDCVLNIQVRCRVPGNCRLQTQTAARLRGSVTLSQTRLQTAAAAAGTHPSLQRSFSAAPSHKVQFHKIDRSRNTRHIKIVISSSFDICDTDPGPDSMRPRVSRLLDTVLLHKSETGLMFQI